LTATERRETIDAAPPVGHAAGRRASIGVSGRGGRNGSALMLRTAAEMVRLKVDVIVATSTPAALAAKPATTTIPIVMFGGSTQS
jgi:hypothetical protein